MSRKYLDDINVSDRPDMWNPNDSRQDFWKEQRDTYGFDERETWSMDYTFRLWLYERLKMYNEIAAVDLTHHKFEYNGKEYNQQEMIDMMLERLKFSFSDDYNDLDDEQSNYVNEVAIIWANVLPAMWW